MRRQPRRPQRNRWPSQQPADHLLPHKSRRHGHSLRIKMLLSGQIFLRLDNYLHRPKPQPLSQQRRLCRDDQQMAFLGTREQCLSGGRRANLGLRGSKQSCSSTTSSTTTRTTSKASWAMLKSEAQKRPSRRPLKRRPGAQQHRLQYRKHLAPQDRLFTALDQSQEEAIRQAWIRISLQSRRQRVTENRSQLVLSAP